MRDRGRGAVVQVDRHQEQSEEKTKSVKDFYQQIIIEKWI